MAFSKPICELEPGDKIVVPNSDYRLWNHGPVIEVDSIGADVQLKFADGFTATRPGNMLVEYER